MASRGGIVFSILIWGIFCDLYVSDTCLQNLCSKHGCANKDNGNKCECYYGWTGSKCEINIDDCKNNPCKNNGTCIDQISRYKCQCTNEYVGTNCQLKNPCLTNPCQNNGKCKTYENEKMVCECRKNFVGEFCQDRQAYCPNNLEKSRKMCNLHGKCEYDNDGALRCQCDIGYSGPKCRTQSKGKIEVGCPDNFCFNEGKCVIQDNGNPSCNCAKEYSGDRCDIYGISNGNKQRKRNEEFEIKIQSNKIIPKKLPIDTISACNPQCQSLRGNGICEQQCNTEKCQYDGGDCDPWKKCKSPLARHCRDVFRNKICNPECNNVDCLFDGQDCNGSPCVNRNHCSTVYQNQICDEDCNNPQCGFDGGDCQGKQTNSFFSNVPNAQKCSSDKKEFELDLILLTNMEEFLLNKSNFLQTLGSLLKMVLTISKITEIKFNSTTALAIKLTINPTECVIYGGQCFSSLEQISNFIEAGINGKKALSLPFRVAKVDSKTVYSVVPKKTEINTSFIVLIVMSLTLIISLIVIGVLLRDKWGRLRTKVKTAGVWTPSEGYSTSTSSINSNHKSGWSASLQPNILKFDNLLPNHCNYDSDIFKFNKLKNSRIEENHEENQRDVTNRKRKYEVSDPNALSFQTISMNLQKRDGVNPLGSSQTKLLNLINENIPLKNEQKYNDIEEASVDIGSYVNDVGESLLHIASRMNCGPNIIKKLYNISPSMLHSTDEWGRTPLATAVASDAFESVEQLLLLEKQSRKELKQNKAQFRQSSYTSCGTVDYPVKKTTGLIESVKLNSKDMINLLLDEASPVNVLDSNGRSVVHWAAMLNNVSLLERLSHMKIFQKLVDLKDNDEQSPLYLAASEGSFESAKFIVEYITKLGIKIDYIFPCPKTVAAENGFTEIETLINDAQLPNVCSEKAYKRMKLKDQKIQKKLSSLSSPTRPLSIIKEYKEYLGDSIKLDKNSPSGLDSIESCLLDIYSLEDYSLNNILDSYTNDRNNYSSFKPNENNCHSYLSNTSSSDMSPPLLNLRNPSLLNGYNCQSDPIDSTTQNAFFLTPNQVMENKTANVVFSSDKTHEISSELYQLEPSPRLNQFQHRSFKMTNLPSINCHL